MTIKLDQLLAELCPEGVEWKKLGEVCEVLRWKRLTKSQLSDDGQYTVYHGWLIPLGYYHEYNREANTVMVINTWSVWEVWWSAEPFWSSDGTFTIKCPDFIQDKYLYYFLKTKEKSLKKEIRSGWVPTIDRLTVEKQTIPIPPLPVQEEIVKILDKFTSLEAELEAELEARKCQYEFYRNQLLAFRGGDVLYKPLSELWILIRWNGLQKSDFVSEGKPCIHYGQIYTHYGTTASRTISQIAPELFDKLKKAEKGDVIFTTTSENFDDIVKCIVWLWDESVAIWWHAAIFKPNNSILWKYFSYYTQTSDFSLQKKKYAKGIKVVDISMSDLEKIKIPLPPLEQQEAIVYILDHFDQLANDLTAGLPAELHLRQQQYAYYRDMLLNFSLELVSERESIK